MKKVLLLFTFFLLFTLNSFSQDTLFLNIREIDATQFAKIKLFLNVLDTKGKPVLKIDAGSITIEEKNTGKRIKPELNNFYESEKEGIAICFLLDASPSMEEPVKYVKSGLLSILDSLRKQDKIAIGFLGDSLVRVSDFTTNRGITRDNLNIINAAEKGGSNIFKSIIDALRWIKDLDSPKRKILVVISDGDDTYKEKSTEDVIKEAKKSGVTVYTIGAIDRKSDTRGTLVNMDKIAESTKDKGGKYYEISKAEDIKKIIPMIYDRIKEEYVLSYWSCAKENDTVNISLEVKKEKSTNYIDYSYFAKEKNQDPPVQECKKKELLIGVIVIGVLIIALAIFLILNILKKSKYRKEKDREKMLREQESMENQQKYDGLYNQYQDILSQMDNQKFVSESDKEKIMKLEQMMNNASKTMVGVVPKQIDFRRRTMILTKSPETSVGASSGAIHSLTVMNGRQSGQQVQVQEFGVLIGRTEGQLILQDETVSRRHARIYFENGKYNIEDFNSTNGTFVNGRRISASSVNPGDIIRVGNIELQFK
jgi:VWFA-related protein